MAPGTPLPILSFAYACVFPFDLLLPLPIDWNEELRVLVLSIAIKSEGSVRVNFRRGDEAEDTSICDDGG